MGGTAKLRPRKLGVKFFYLYGRKKEIMKNKSNSNYPSLGEFKEAQNRLSGVIKETKLIYSEFLSCESGNQIYLKPENTQITGAYKIRGAYNKLCQLSPEEKSLGVIASSAGNHAQGVAFSAEKLGISATIVMPKSTPLIKVDATKKFGAEVILRGNVYDEAYTDAVKISDEKGHTFIHPFDDRDVIIGQGTIALEILEEINDVDILIVPLGGGGLVSGIACAAKQINPDIYVIGVEPEGANAMQRSIENNYLTTLDSVRTIADGAAVRKPGELTFEMVKRYVDKVVTVSDFELMEYFLLLLEKHKLVGETAGVLSLAALKNLEIDGLPVCNKKIVCIVSGGNIDVVTVSSMISKGLVSRGRLFCFSVDLPDRPGELLNISKILSDLNANVIKLNHDQFRVYDRFMNVCLEVTVETSGHKHIEKIIKTLEENGYEPDRKY